jgi:tetratricopeptide (TPR) repeat protein
MPDLHNPPEQSNRRERLLKVWHLALVALITLLALALVASTSYPMEATGGRLDGLALQHLRLLVAVRTKDGNLKLRLAQALFATGQLQEASKLLDSFSIDDPELRQWAARLRFQLHLAQFTAARGSQADELASKQRLGQELEALLAFRLSAMELAELAASSLIIERPDLAARIYLRLVETDPKQRRKWLAAAAEQQNACSRPEVAGLLYDQLFQLETDEELAKQYARLALRALISADKGHIALSLVRQYLVRFPTDSALLETAGRLALAHRQPARAARYYEDLANQLSDRSQQRQFAMAAVLALIASNQTDAALLAIKFRLLQFPTDPELLRIGIKLALGNQLVHQAQQWGRLLLSQGPMSRTDIASQLSLELAAGDLTAAYKLARRLVNRSPHDAKQRERLAQLAEWSGQPHLALIEWVHLALQTNKQSYLDRALKMAPQLYELEQLATLLGFMARRGRLSNAELLSLVETFEGIAEPEKLVAILDDYLRRYPDHREAWQALAEVHERRGDLTAALSTFEQVSRVFGSSLSEITHRASLLWELQKPSEAYVLLRDTLQHAGIKDGQALLIQLERARVSEHTPQLTDTQFAQQSFLLLLSQLFFFHEPQPESLDDYRRLWRDGALVIQGAGRYMYLAETKGLSDEAISVGETAFARFKDPEFLLSAMEIAHETKRFPELERLIAQSHAHIELFAKKRYYYLLLADYYTQKGEYSAAQAAYQQLLTLDPESMMTRAALLWMHIDHSEDLARQQGKRSRAELARLLAKWRELAKTEPALWLPFATGYSLLGRSQDALAFYQREWTSRPTDHLWLLGYLSTLESVGRSRAVQRLRRFALTELRPAAILAAHEEATQSEREHLKAYVELVRDSYGAGKGSRWLRKVLHRDLDLGVQKGLVALWRSSGEQLESSAWVTASSPPPAQPKKVQGRVLRAHKPSQYAPPASLTDSGSLPKEQAEPPPAPLRVLAQDVSAGEGQVLHRSQIVNLETVMQTINDLLIAGGSVTALVARGAWAVGAHLGVKHLILSAADDPQAGSTEVDLRGSVLWRHRLGRLELGLGTNWRADGNLFSGWASESFPLWRGGTLQLGIHLNEQPSDTRWLRIYGARHRATLGLSTNFLTDGNINLQTNFFHYHTRKNEALSAGINADIDLGYRIRRVRPLWTVRATGSYTRNFLLADQLPSFGSDSTSAPALLDALPETFASVGIGSHVEHRFPGTIPTTAGRFRYMADVWVGWMWPVNLVGVEARSGVSLVLPRRQEISLSGFVGNNRWLGPGVVNAGLSLGYLFR